MPRARKIKVSDNFVVEMKRGKQGGYEVFLASPEVDDCKEFFYKKRNSLMEVYDDEVDCCDEEPNPREDIILWFRIWNDTKDITLRVRRL